MRVVGEIGLNHLGDFGAAKRMLDAAADQGLTDVTFQLREASYYDGGKPHRNPLSEVQYVALLDQARSRGVTLGFACSDIEMVAPLDAAGCGFWKVLSKDLGDDGLIDAVVATGKEVVCSTGLSSAERITGMVERHPSVGLIHTQLSHAIEDVNLEALNVLSDHGRPVHFGLHAENPEVLILALPYRPEALWVYLRPDDDASVPDGVHALPIGSLKAWTARLNHLERALGDGAKIDMERST